MRYAHWLTVCFLVIVAVNVQDAAAEVEVADIQYAYYPVKPEPGRSLYQQLFKDTPLRLDNGRTVLGLAAWNIQYETQYARSGRNLCETQTLLVSSGCTITLPRLETDDARLIQDFNAFMPLLKAHELTHCQIAVDYARRMEARMKTLGRQECGGLEEAFKAAFSQIMAEAKSAQESFDQATRVRDHQSNPVKALLGDSYLNASSPPAETPVKTISSIDNKALPDEYYQDSDGVWKNY